jgi:tetratricopeptide (TPR) repeat protein
LTVCPHGCEYSSVQAAVNAAHPGDTLRVYSGIYNESVNINKDLHLIYIDTGGGVKIKGLTSLGSTGIFSVELPEQDPGVMKYTATYWLDKGKESYSKGSYETAIDYFNKSLWVDPLNLSVWYMKAITLEGLSRYYEAIKCTNTIIEAAPNSAEAWAERAKILEALGNENGAAASLEKARDLGYTDVELNPDSVEALLYKGLALYNQDKYDEAIKAYDEAIRIYPHYADAWNNKGIALGMQGKYDEAIQALEKALELNHSYHEGWNYKGGILRALGMYDEAIKAYDEAIRLDPTYAKAWNNKGEALKALGRTSEANAAKAKAKELGYNR